MRWSPLFLHFPCGFTQACGVSSSDGRMVVCGVIRMLRKRSSL
uniref:Uncharacterized protein n=1 Tax=Arundo donax TaxID=35708 RepID=A0A0A9BK75_ARUDO